MTHIYFIIIGISCYLLMNNEFSELAPIKNRKKDQVEFRKHHHYVVNYLNILEMKKTKPFVELPK